MREVWIWVNAVLTLTSLKTEKIWWFDHSRSQKFSVKIASRKIIDTLLWCRTWPPNGSSRTCANQKLLRKLKGACKSFWSRIRSLKSFTLTILWNLAKFVKIFLGIIARRHHTDRRLMVLRKEQCAVWNKGHICCAIAVRSEWRMVRILWNVIAFCPTFKISQLVGKQNMKGGSECVLTGQEYRLEQWSNVTVILRKTSQDCISLEQKFCQVNSFNVCCRRKGAGKGALWSQTLKNWRIWTHQNSTHFPSDGTVKIFGGEQRLRTST